MNHRADHIGRLLAQSLASRLATEALSQPPRSGAELLQADDSFRTEPVPEPVIALATYVRSPYRCQ